MINFFKSQASSNGGEFKKVKSLIRNITHSQPSVIVPAESWITKPTQRLIDIVCQAIPVASEVDHTDIAEKMMEYPHWPVIWPGEHYRLLTALVQVLQPKLVIEIGTATGYSSLSMKKTLPQDGKIVSFDIIPWKEFPKCILRDEDFADGRLGQVIADLTDKEVFDEYKELLSKADFVFIDAAKDGLQEKTFIDHFKTIQYKYKPIFMFDDIRVINMIDIWQNLDLPKWDITSLGHWAGTGLVDWTAK